MTIAEYYLLAKKRRPCTTHLKTLQQLEQNLLRHLAASTLQVCKSTQIKILYCTWRLIPRHKNYILYLMRAASKILVSLQNITKE
jgi:hypothetical protein